MLLHQYATILISIQKNKHYSPVDEWPDVKLRPDKLIFALIDGLLYLI